MTIIESEDIKFNQEWTKMKKKLIIQITEEVNMVNQSIDNKADSED